ncbi:saccharopine dehydrogenase family protein [Natronorubrum aibiense]|uniref:Saccharopine dehydrogenase n=1 Tax=Natronorubrum aibiense TaxID=348826 RepID=A0A5P9P584_9EURY|nr:saccharopine dehydrogenase NADP-binding domain-containing protein [Natronorubrum aibiense]QFU83331.1 saccharopine dehydrogenase [Natronorubrum aibiense]
MDSLLIYGSYGYTGRLIAREAVSRGGSPVVAGRDARAVTRQADELGVEGRTFALSDDVAAQLRRFDAVLNCAGPFSKTVDPLVDACLETGTDYLDVTGEFQVFERLRQHDAGARAADVTLLPGVGFEVVPSDCLAAFLHEQLPSATALSLGLKGNGPLSRGTARTVVEQLGSDGVVRRNGRLIKVPTAFRTREIDFGTGPEHAVTIPGGDVVTAAHSTDIDTIELYAAMPSWATRTMAAADSLGWLLARRPVETLVKRLVDARVDGPDARERARSDAVVWGEAVDESTGRRARARMRTPNPYTLTADAAVSAAERVLDGRDRIESRVPAGFQTPASAFGSEFVLKLEGTTRDVLETPTETDDSNRSTVESDD